MSCEDEYSFYIQKKIGSLQLVNIQDVCMGIAISMHYDDNIPDGILTNAQLKIIENSENIDKDHSEKSPGYYQPKQSVHRLTYKRTVFLCSRYRHEQCNDTAAIQRRKREQVEYKQNEIQYKGNT